MTNEELIAKHSDYEAHLPSWEFFSNSYFGGKRYRDGKYLMQHAFESLENFTRRQELAYYYNYCQPIVDIFVSLLYKQTPERDFGSLKGDLLFESFLKDSDLEGNSFQEFVREAERYAGVYGRVSVIVDRPSISTDTVLEARDNDIRPYLTLITPEHIIDWEYVRLGNGRTVLDMVKVVEEWNGDNPSIIRIWTRDGWELFSIDEDMPEGVNVKSIDSGTYDFGRVPMVNLYNKNSTTRMLGLSDLEDIADINKNIYSLCSDSLEIIENTAYPMLAMAYETGGEETKETGPKNIMQFDGEVANSKPFWLEAPHTSLAEIREWISQNRSTIYRIANLSGIKNSGDSKQPWSGTALEIENQQRDAVLSEKAANAEQFENKILDLYALWEGEEFDGNIDYPSDFSIKDVDLSTSHIINTLRDVKFDSVELQRWLEKKLAKNLLKQDLSDEESKKLEEDIDDSKRIEAPVE